MGLVIKAVAFVVVSLAYIVLLSWGLGVTAKIVVTMFSFGWNALP